jgi:SAM-dependent methyltransferase
MVREYDDQIASSALARADVAFCERAFGAPGRLLDLGCGTGRLCVHFAARGYECVGVDLSDEMLAKAADNARLAGVSVVWQAVNLVDLADLPNGSFDYAACLFSTLGMVRGAENRAKVVANAYQLLKPGGRFVLHVHNRSFRGLGLGRVLRNAWRGLLRRPDAGDISMPQAYGGAPLTLHHFTRREAEKLLTEAGFAVSVVEGVGLQGAPRSGGRSVYGYLMVGDRLKREDWFSSCHR